MSDLKPWPNIGPCREGWYAYPDLPEEFKARIHPYMVENNEIGQWVHKDQYEAALARLRVAVEALRHLIAMVGECSCHEAYTGRNLTDPNCGYCNWEAEAAVAALSAIGPLPSEDKS